MERVGLEAGSVVRARVPSGMSFTLAGSAVRARRSYIFLRRLRRLRLCVEGFPRPGGTGGACSLRICVTKVRCLRVE